ncbi:MAG: hypothetical protein EVJ47_05880 [Candidatus Acidulodesulfobacterium ferriphilum]|uniref:Uncharacterized protein n=1 Tax=Candidatus Acidulodesulfobacterium ferriphilum TaxID=2597223 RepID=A0A519BBN0_9DELT|nr:MAG: hypothetical protein EVJ47_05880 [Candidatus Acidulodesulfobacterium ferriphilum]
MIKYEYIADKLYEAGLKVGYIAEYLGLGYKDLKIIELRKRERKEKSLRKEPSLYKKFISSIDLSDERVKEFVKIIKARKIDYNKWGELLKKYGINDNSLTHTLLSQKGFYDFSKDSDFFAVKDYLDDICRNEKLKLSSNDIYFLYGKFLKKIYVDPRKDIEFLLKNGVSYYNIAKLFNNSLSGVNGRDFRTMTKTFKRPMTKPHKNKADEEALKKIITGSKMNANIINAVRLVKFFSKRDANHIVQVLLENSFDCSSAEVEKRIGIPLEMLFEDGRCVFYDNI